MSSSKATRIANAFPPRNSSSSSSLSTKNDSQSELNANSPSTSQGTSTTPITLPPVTRFAFASLTTSVIRLDFWNDFDPHSIFFCKIAFESVMNAMMMPEKTQKIFKNVLEGVDEVGDLTDAIMAIKSNEEITENGGPIVLLEGLLLAFIATGNYDSRYRVLLRHLATLLAIPWEDFEEIESCLALTMMNEEFVESAEKDSEYSRQMREKSHKMKRLKRYLMIGAAGGVSGVLMGLTGGLAAPLVAAGAGALFSTGVIAAIGTTAGAAILGTTFGVAGAGLAGYKMKKRVGAIEEFTVESLSHGTSLHCALVVSGWIDRDTSPEIAFEHPWRHLSFAPEQYSLRYESKYLEDLGKSMEYFVSFAVSVAIQQGLMETALAGLLTAVAWPVAILGASSVLDNPWNVCVSRSAEVGNHLAEVLLLRSHGKRPITLIGFSLGARVIYHCLLAMSKRAECVGIIEDVILLGAPVTASPKQWEQISTVVGGRIINGYCETDWLLRFLYRTMSVQFSIAGTSPINMKNTKKICNINLSHIVKGHMDYSKRLTEVLAAVGLRVGPHSEDSVPDLSNLDDSAHVPEAQDALFVPGPSSNALSTTNSNWSGVDIDSLADNVKEFKVVDK